MRRYCLFCGLESDNLELFIKAARYKYGRRNTCKACGHKRRTPGVTKRQKVLRQRLHEVKSAPCTDCGVRYPPYVMDMDHVGEKLFTIGKAVGTASVTLDQLEAELASCEVVCANCHRERTHRRRASACA